MNPRSRLATQVALLTTAVTVVAVAVSFVISAGLISRAARTQARQTLGHYADLVADAASAGAVARRGAVARPFFRLAGIVRVNVRADGVATVALGSLPVALPASLVGAAATGQVLDETVALGRRSYFVEGRPLADGRGAVVLVQPVTAAGEITSPLRGRLLVALGLGLAVAVVAGVALSRRLARPLVRAAAAADQLAHGRRDVRLEASGPAEVAAVTEALNALAGALHASESRQRNFLLSVSHELRTPLTAIAGYAEALADGIVQGGEVAGVGATLATEAGRLQRLVGDLLDLARLGAADFRIVVQPVDLVRLLGEATDVWGARCSAAGVVLSVESPGGPLEVRTDPGRVRQILDGLAENALRVAPVGAPLVLAVRRAGAGAELEVRDGGPGLSDADIAVAFEPSALYDRYRGVRRVGTGIGLALIAGLAARLGGSAAAGHAPEGGACFTVTLPDAAGPDGFTER